LWSVVIASLSSSTLPRAGGGLFIVGISQKARNKSVKKILDGKDETVPTANKNLLQRVVESYVFKFSARRKEFEYGGGLRDHEGVCGFCLEVRNSLIIQ